MRRVLGRFVQYKKVHKQNGCVKCADSCGRTCGADNSALAHVTYTGLFDFFS
uniref:Radical SAM protein n=1 Tax=Macrostomum lignano TaxID=282301 RepID=A0A1I8GF57_9PLAT